MRDVLIALMLIGMVAILATMWIAFPSMLIGNILVTIGFIAWAVWVFQT